MREITQAKMERPWLGLLLFTVAVAHRAYSTELMDVAVVGELEDVSYLQEAAAPKAEAERLRLPKKALVRRGDLGEGAGVLHSFYF